VSTDKYLQLMAKRCLHLWDQEVQMIHTCDCFTLNLKELPSFEASVNILHWAWCIVAQEFNLQHFVFTKFWVMSEVLHLWQNLKFH